MLWEDLASIGTAERDRRLPRKDLLTSPGRGHIGGEAEDRKEMLGGRSTA